jgi:hypothetical protein
MKWFLLISFVLITCSSGFAQKQVKVHFLYGSVPSGNFKGIEKKRFGGKKGGHVTIQVGDSIIGFQPGGNCHVVAYAKPNGYFKVEKESQWTKDSVGNKYTSIIIPVSDSQYNLISQRLNSYLTTTPYDYAVFGMRCAAATYDILEDISIVPEKSKTAKWSSFFYPQLLRRHLLKIAKEKNYQVIRHEGVKSRSWEKE